jgi:signal transduction histidine kinase
MRDLSLHLLDLAQNSITAGAKLVTIGLTLDEKGMMTFTLEDDGKGMPPELLSRVTSPFSTTRTTRKVGLGIPMMMENARLSGGDLTIRSEVGKGTTAHSDPRYAQYRLPAPGRPARHAAQPDPDESRQARFPL